MESLRENLIIYAAVGAIVSIWLLWIRIRFYHREDWDNARVTSLMFSFRFSDGLELYRFTLIHDFGDLITRSLQLVNVVLIVLTVVGLVLTVL